MSQNALLEEKIIRLVLSELGHPVEGERLFLLSHDPSLTEEIMRLKERIESLAQGLSARVSEGYNGARSPLVSIQPFRSATNGRK